MAGYADKNELIQEIRKTADAFIKEFDEVAEAEKDIRYEEVDRTPQELIAYQLGWMNLLRGWDRDELAGKEVITPAPGYKWNQMGALYQGFYDQYQDKSLEQLKEEFETTVSSFLEWLDGFSEEQIFEPAGRKWAASIPSNWPIWRWVHTNTAAPFKTFRSKIRKWKKIRAAQ